MRINASRARGVRALRIGRNALPWRRLRLRLVGHALFCLLLLYYPERESGFNENPLAVSEVFV